jgi:hypothetical protein
MGKVGPIGMLEQTYRTVAKTRIDYFLQMAKKDCPETRFLLIEPHPENPTMFANPFQFEKLDRCIKQGRAKVKRIFREHRSELEKVFNENGLSLNWFAIKREDSRWEREFGVEDIDEILF